MWHVLLQSQVQGVPENIELTISAMSFAILASKSYGNVQANSSRKLNFSNHPTKFNIHEWVIKFQATRTIHNLNCKAESLKSE